MRGEALCQHRKKRQRRAVPCGRLPSGHLPGKQSFSSEVTGSAAPDVAASHRHTSLKKTRPLNSVCPLLFFFFFPFYRLNPKAQPLLLPATKHFSRASANRQTNELNTNKPPRLRRSSVSQEGTQNELHVNVSASVPLSHDYLKHSLPSPNTHIWSVSGSRPGYEENLLL